MVGRLDDWLKAVAKRDGIVTTPGDLDWAGVAVMKKAYGLYKARNYRARLLAAAYRSHLHWSEFIGGDVVLTLRTSGRCCEQLGYRGEERMQNPSIRPSSPGCTASSRSSARRTTRTG